MREVDELTLGELIGTLDMLTIYRDKKIMSKQQAAPRCVSNLMQLLEIANGPPMTLRKLRSILLIYDSDTINIDDFATFVESLMDSYKCAWCCGSTQATTEVSAKTALFIFRGDFKHLPASFAFNGMEPTAYKFKLRGQNANTGQALVTRSASSNGARAFVAVLKEMRTNMHLMNPCKGPQEYSFERMLTLTTKLTDMELNKLRGEAQLVPDGEKSGFQWALLKSWTSLKDHRALQKPASDLTFSAYSPPLPIVPLDKMCAAGLQQVGRVRDERSNTYVDHTIESLFKTSLCFKYSILICGSDATTGFGKSQVALRLAIELSTAIVETHNLPKANAQVIFATTLDSLKGLAMPLGTVIVFDDVCPSDKEQIVLISENGMKCRLNPRVVATCRGRNFDITIPLGIPRIFTANVVNGIAWCGARLAWSLPLQRRMIVCRVTQRLIDITWMPSGESALDMDVIAARLAGNPVPLLPPPAVAPDFGSWGRLLRTSVSALYGSMCAHRNGA